MTTEPRSVEPLSAEDEAELRAGIARIFRDYVPTGEDRTIRRLLATLDAERATRASAGAGLPTPLELQVALDRIDPLYPGYWDRRQKPDVYLTNAGLALALTEELRLAATRPAAEGSEE